MKKTCVLHLIDSNGIYGAETVVLTLLDNLQTSSYHCILGCIRERKNENPQIAIEAQKIGIPLQYFTMKRGYNPFGLQRILKYIRDTKIQIVHSHGYKPNIYLASLPIRKFKTISTVHGWANKTAGIKGRIYEFLDSIALKRIDRVVAVSKAVRSDLVKHGLQEETIDLIYNGLTFRSNTPQFDISKIRQKYGFSNDDYVIGAVGRLSTVKGHGYLIKAMPEVLKEIKNCKLVIAGDGPLKSNLRNLIERLNISYYVKLIGYVKDIDKFLAMIDLFLLPSLSEGLPISLLEAMAMGKPVLASAVGGIPEVIENGNTGFLTPPANVHSISKTINSLYMTKERMKKIGINGSNIVREKFSSAKMVKNYSNAYFKILVSRTVNLQTHNT